MYTLEEKHFHGHLYFLSCNNFTGILVEDYCRSLLDLSFKLPEKCVIITFDDGHESDYEIALPHLKRFDFKANFFITTGWIGKQGYMSTHQLRTLEEEGMSIQSHAKTHSFLDEMGVSEICHELEQSKRTLEGILGKKVSFISVPGGRYNRKVIECARKLGYSSVFCSTPFHLRKFDGIYVIGRHIIKYSWGRTDFEKIISIGTFGKAKYIAGYIGKYLLKKILGNKTYYFIWKKYIES
jgi:peptidoglycan/xylan/chitin deacetylase (PgdA/CDA1 family)